MLNVGSAPVGGSRAGLGFVLYLEGPGDRRILSSWCRRLMPSLAKRLSGCTVILGGRQPARAVSHFRGLGGAGAGVRGLCVLDRDGAGAPPVPESTEPGLDFFTWGRRHIESYLLVPAAVRRGMDGAGARAERMLRDHLPPEGDLAAWCELDAKRLLGPHGPLARGLGLPIPLARIARGMRESELHADVHSVFSRLRHELEGPATIVVR